MRTLYTFFLLFLFAATAHSQKQQLPEIPYNWYKGKVSPYYKQLGIRDKSAIIVTAGELPNYRSVTFKYAVYFKDGSVRMFTEDDNNVITEIIPSEEQKTALKDFLYNTHWLKIVDYNLTGKDSDTFIILDGTLHYFNIIQGDKEYSLVSQHSLSNIERKVPGWEDRLKLLELIKKFESYFSI